VDNQVRLQLFVLAYNLGNFLRQSVLPQSVRHWTLTILREKLIKIGAKVVRHSRQIIFQMAEVGVPCEILEEQSMLPLLDAEPSRYACSDAAISSNQPSARSSNHCDFVRQNGALLFAILQYKNATYQ
jgi:hypothetical protein